MVKVDRPTRTVATAQTPLDTFKVDYSGIGQAGRAIASGLMDISGAIKENEKQAKAAQEYDNNIGLSNWETNTKLELTNLRTSTEVGTANYLDQVKQMIELRRGEFLNGLSADAQKEFEQKATALGNAMILGEREFDIKQRQLFFGNKVAERVKVLQKEVYSDSTALEKARETIEAEIDASGLTPDAKLMEKQKALESLALIAFTADVKARRQEENLGTLNTDKQPIASKGLTPAAYPILKAIAKDESGGRYNVRYDGSPTGATFTSYADHPRVKVNGSTAAGAYMITAQTWDEFAPKVGVTDFSPASQDKVAMAIADSAAQKKGYPNAAAMLEAGAVYQLKGALATRWVAVKNMDIDVFKSAITAAGAKDLDTSKLTFVLHGRRGNKTELSAADNTFGRTNPQLTDAVSRAYVSLGLGEVHMHGAARSLSANKKAGGAKNSQHLHDNAFDLDVSKMSIDLRKNLIRSLSAAGVKGLGIGRNTIHVDMGGLRAWGYKTSAGGGPVPDWAQGVISQHLAGKFAKDGAQSLITDPRYADLSLAQMQAATRDGMAEADREYNDIVKQRKGAEDSQRNSLYIGLMDGTYNTADIARARQEGILTDYDDIVKANKILSDKDKNVESLILGREHLESGASWDRGNSDHAKWANALHEESTRGKLDEQDLEYVESTVVPSFEKMGYAAPNMVNQLEGLARSNNPAKVMFALESMRMLREVNRNAFAAQFDEKLQTKLDILEYGKEQLPAETLNRVLGAQPINSADAASLEIRRKESAKLYEDTLKDNPAKVGVGRMVQYFDSILPFDEPTPPLSHTVSTALDKEFRTAFETHYIDTGNVDYATQMAEAAVARRWGITEIGGERRLAKWAPDKVGYTQHMGSYDWIDKQVRSDMGWDETVKFQLVPTESIVTEMAAYKANPGKAKPPSYLIWYTKEDGEAGYAMKPGTNDLVPVYFEKTKEMLQAEDDDFNRKALLATEEFLVDREERLQNEQRIHDVLNQFDPNYQPEADPTRPTIPAEVSEEADAVRDKRYFDRKDRLQQQMIDDGPFGARDRPATKFKQPTIRGN